jgi:hypothetical protein
MSNLHMYVTFHLVSEGPEIWPHSRTNKFKSVPNSFQDQTTVYMLFWW